jgi:hypothetical protein
LKQAGINFTDVMAGLENHLKTVAPIQNLPQTHVEASQKDYISISVGPVFQLIIENALHNCGIANFNKLEDGLITLFYTWNDHFFSIFEECGCQGCPSYLGWDSKQNKPVCGEEKSWINPKVLDSTLNRKAGEMCQKRQQQDIELQIALGVNYNLGGKRLTRRERLLLRKYALAKEELDAYTKANGDETEIIKWWRSQVTELRPYKDEVHKLKKHIKRLETLISRNAKRRLQYKYAQTQK